MVSHGKFTLNFVMVTNSPGGCSGVSKEDLCPQKTLNPSQTGTADRPTVPPEVSRPHTEPSGCSGVSVRNRLLHIYLGLL